MTASNSIRQRSVGDFVLGNALSFTLLAAFLCGCLVLGALYSEIRVATTLMWALGYGAAGVLLGFIFCVPKTAPSPQAAPANASPAPVAVSDSTTQTPAASISAPAGTEARMQINNNLVEISDWLTKIIVGVGLVEFKDLAGHAQTVAKFMGSGIAAGDLGTTVAGGVMLYFSMLGFLSGYLLTRIYISQWFSFADSMTRDGEVRVGSTTVDIDEWVQTQQPVIEDLQSKVAAMQSRLDQAPVQIAGEGEPAKAADHVRQLRVLWVDDEPRNNLQPRSVLDNEGHRVVTTLSTKQALEALRRTPFDVVITDMHRNEDGRQVPDAGLDLIRESKELNPATPVLVFCGRTSAARYGEKARALGAEIVTTSGVDLLSTIRSIALA